MLLGRYGEALAAEYLRKKGCRILGMNYRTRLGEIDVIEIYAPDGVDTKDPDIRHWENAFTLD